MLPLSFVAEPVASFVHLGGAVVTCLLAKSLLRAGSGSRARQVSLGVFVGCLAMLLTVSGVYHVFSAGTVERTVLQRLDHAGIWIATAGCATTLWYFFLRHTRVGAVFLVGVWGVAGVGTFLKTVYFDVIPDRFGVLFFVAFGSLGIPVVLWLVGTRGLYYARWFFCCGVLLTLGALLEMIEAPTLVPGIVGYHELVHVFVMAGLFCHWTFVHGLALEEQSASPAADIGVEGDLATVRQ
jgi:channel protein (hemolysin III family)